ncbi:MAG: XrtA system polysaccharide chain length determinant, partial [Pseudomonadota bacterium]
MKDLFELIIREIRGSWRFRWPAMITTWSICLLGWFLIFSMPDMYEASTRVYVDTSSRLKNILGKITNAPDVESDVTAVRQAMLGRQQLERVARETDLFLRAETAEDEQRLLDDLAAKINIAVGSRRQSRAGLYTISYTDPDKQMSEDVVRTLLDTFVEDVLEQKAQGSEEAQTFIVEQVEYYEKLLEENEAALAQFKKENLGLMPGEGGGYFERLQATIAAKELVERNLRIAVSKRDELQAQLSGQKPQVRSNGDNGLGGGLAVSSGDPELDLRISTMQGDLSDMLLRFTEKHPDVVNTRRQLDQLLAQREAMLSAAAGGGGSGTSLAANPIYQATLIALNDTKVQISALQRELADYNSREAELKALADTV